MEIFTVIGFSREMEQYVKPRLISLSTIHTIFDFYGSPYLIQYILKPILNKTIHTADCQSLHQFILHTTMSYLKQFPHSIHTNDKIQQAIDYIIHYSINILISCCYFDLDNNYQRKLFLPTFEFFQSLITQTDICKHKDICIKLRTALINNIPKPTKLRTVYEPIVEYTPYINTLIFLLAKNDGKGMKTALTKNKPIDSSLIFDTITDIRFSNFCKWLWG
eukprot:854551_1